ncbi:MAG: hypothetical protein JWM59_4776 [Verrucomicrobiales bacterium]|nr:hypothetical protein [Verrucomicrobiales bacterium]
MPGKEPPPAQPGPASGAPSAEARARALSLYYKARRLERESDDESALAIYLEALAISGTGPELNARLVRIYTSPNRLEEALALQEKLVADFPQSPGALLTLSRFLEEHQNHAPGWKACAVETARQAVAKFPDSDTAVRHLVRLYLTAQERAKAQEVVEQALRSSSNGPSFWLSLSTSAREAFPLDDPATRARHFEIVSKTVERALELAGDDPTVLAEAADFYARARRADKALPLYERTAALRPGDLAARQKLGQCLRMAGRDADAAAVFEALVTVDAGDVVSHKALMSLYENTDAAKSLKHRAEVLRLEGGDPRDYAAAATELMKGNQPGEAFTLLRRGIFFNPESANLHYLLARTQDAKGDFSSALQSLAEAESIAKTRAPRLLDAAFYYSWAGVARRAGKLEEAESRYRQSIGGTPRNKPELAAPAYNDLGWLWLTGNKNLDVAGELLRTANELVKDHPPYLDSLGWFHFLKKDYSSALACLRKAAELSQPRPGPELLEHLVQAEAAAKAAGVELPPKENGERKEGAAEVK